MKRVIFTCILLLFVPLCLADTIYLKDGQIFRGDIISQDDKTVVIETYGGNEEALDRQYISRIISNENYYNYRRRMIRGYRSEGRWVGDEWIFKIGIDFDGKHETSNSNLFIEGAGNSSIDGTQDINSGASFGGEYVSYVTKNIGLGGGLTVQLPRGLTGVAGNFSFSPLYGLVKARTSPGKMNTYEYLTGQIGYNFFDGDLDYRGSKGSLDGGLYFGLGAGVAINRVQIEFLYTEDRGRAKASGFLYDPQTGESSYFRESGDIKYSKYGMSIGFIF